MHSARRLAEVCAQKAEASFQTEAARIKAVHASTTQRLNDHWKQVRDEARILRSGWTDRLTDQARKLVLANEERRVGSGRRGHER